MEKGIMEKKLQYKFSPDFVLGEGVDFAHEWKIEMPYFVDIPTLREMVAWCYENWNEDPNWDHEWQYTVEADVRHFYNATNSSWSTWESPNRFYFGTDDDEWAVTFKLRWSDSIE
jgi:hypothetical protein